MNVKWQCSSWNSGILSLLNPTCENLLEVKIGKKFYLSTFVDLFGKLTSLSLRDVFFSYCMLIIYAFRCGFFFCKRFCKCVFLQASVTGAIKENYLWTLPLQKRVTIFTKIFKLQLICSYSNLKIWTQKR